MSRPAAKPACTPSHNAAADRGGSSTTLASATAGAACAGAGADATVPCRFPRDGDRSELVRRPACRLVLSIHDELLYEVRGAGTVWAGMYDIAWCRNALNLLPVGRRY